MSISVFPAPSTVPVPAIKYVTATIANKLYENSGTYPAGVYTVTSPSAVVATVEFYSGSTLLVSGTTASGIISVNLASVANKVKYFVTSSSSVSIGIEQTGVPITTSDSGVLTTFTTNATLSTPGTYYFTIVGAGGGGGAGGTNGTGGGGGGSGGVQNVGPVAVTNNATITVGTPGNGGTNMGTNGNAGNASSVAITGGSTYTANGGGGGGFGAPPNGNTGGAGGTGGTPGGGVGGVGRQNQAPANASSSMSPPYVGGGNIFGTTGGGGGGGLNSRDGGAPAGSGIGTGGLGSGAATNELPTTGNGYGAGGGAGGMLNVPGAAGRAGVVFAIQVS